MVKVQAPAAPPRFSKLAELLEKRVWSSRRAMLQEGCFWLPESRDKIHNTRSRKLALKADVGMFPLILTVLNRDSNRGHDNPYEGLLLVVYKGEHPQVDVWRPVFLCMFRVWGSLAAMRPGAERRFGAFNGCLELVAVGFIGCRGSCASCSMEWLP